MAEKWKSTKPMGWGYINTKTGEMFRAAIRRHYPKEWAIFYRSQFGRKGKFVESTINRTKNKSVLNLKRICGRKITARNALSCATKLRRLKTVDYPKTRRWR